MQKSDFKKEQIVFLKYIGDRRHGTIGDIKEAIVKSVGSKYITVTLGRWEEYKFIIDEDFRQYYDIGGQDYELYLTRQQIEDENEALEITDFIIKYMPQGYGRHCAKLPLDKLRRIKAIIEE